MKFPFYHLKKKVKLGSVDFGVQKFAYSYRIIILSELIVSRIECIVIDLFVMQSVKCRQELLSTYFLMKVPFMLV